MKNLWWISIFFLSGGFLFAQTIDKPAATLKLEKFEVITIKQFQQKISAIETATRTTLSVEDQKKLLDLQVGELLIQQDAEKMKISVTQAELNARIKQTQQLYALQLKMNRELTDSEFASLLQRNGLTWDQFVKQLEKTMIAQKYVMLKKKPFFDAIPEPDNNEIEDFYQSNKTAFVSPDLVRFRHIYIDTRNLQSKAERNKAGDRASEIYRELQNGTSFEDLVVKYSDDKNSRYRGGDFGFLRRDDQARKQLLGKDFFEAPFKMEVSDISNVLKSNIGYHIIKIVEKMPFKLLELDDKIPPQNQFTVKEEIKAQLLQQKQGQYYQRALLDLLDDLKKKAEIKIFEKNLNW